MVNLRLPRQLGNVDAVVGFNKNQNLSLTDALTQPQWFIEGKVLIPKTQMIVHSRDVIFFYIDRRYKAFNYTSINKPFMFAGFLPSLSGLDSVNNTPITFMENITVGQDSFDLRSVIFTETTDLQDKGGVVITGCTAGIVLLDTSTGGKSYVQYDPQGAGFQHETVDGNYVSYEPVSELSLTNNMKQMRVFQTLAETRGTIFMYAKRSYTKTY